MRGATQRDPSFASKRRRHLEPVMANRKRNKPRRNAATNASHGREQEQGSPDEFRDFVDVLRAHILGNKLDCCTAQAQIKNSEIAQHQKSDGENAVTIRAQAPDDLWNGQDAHGHGQNLTK